MNKITLHVKVLTCVVNYKQGWWHWTLVKYNPVNHTTRKLPTHQCHTTNDFWPRPVPHDMTGKFQVVIIPLHHLLLLLGDLHCFTYPPSSCRQQEGRACGSHAWDQSRLEVDKAAMDVDLLVYELLVKHERAWVK